MEFLTEYGLFLAKAITIVIAVGVVVGLILNSGQAAKKSAKGHIEVTKLNDRFDEMKDFLKSCVLDEHRLKEEAKSEKKRLKKENTEKKKAAKAAKGQKVNVQSGEAVSAETDEKRIFVISFYGDIKASATAHMKEEITAILTVAKPQDEVVVKLESGGGMVHSYGFASSQLARITAAKIPLTVCVDKVAASGGYMMACVADKIIAAPFAVLGSIGVVAQIPNFHRLLKKNDVDIEMITAGEYKRTLTMLGENTEHGREKFLEDIEDTHELFKEFVSSQREQVDIVKVATGEVWFGQRALEVSLVDELQTSDDYLWQQAANSDIYEIEYVLKKNFSQKLGFAAQEATDNLLVRWWGRLNNSRFF